MSDPTRKFDPKTRPAKVRFPLELTEDLRADMESKGWVAVALCNEWEVLRMREVGSLDEESKEPTFKPGEPLVIYKRGNGGIGTVSRSHRDMVSEYLKGKA